MAPVIISYSELDTYRQCPFKHQLAYAERWVSPVDSPALDKGKRTHTALEFWYADPERMTDPVQTMQRAKVSAGLLDLNGDPKDDTANLVCWMLDGYVEMYGSDSGWTVVAVEHPIEIKLPGTATRIKGKIDLLVTDARGRLWLVDHKTGQNLPKDKDLDLDVQFAIYAWAMKSLGKPVHGMIYNSIRTQRNKGPMDLEERFSRRLLVRSDAELDAVARDVAQDAREMLAALRKAQRTGIDRPRHFDTERCGWRCSFTEACLAGVKQVRGGTRGYLGEIGFVQNFERH